MVKKSNKKNKQKKKSSKAINNKYPFIVHLCPTSPAYPAHTHGLKEIGMPEFIMDPMAFSPKGNGAVICRVYDYVTKKKNVGDLDMVKIGQTIKLSTNDIYPEVKEDTNYVYCLRRVFANFQAVKEAYVEGGVKPGMWFVQIYIEGDDFALTDDYYRGGVTWQLKI